MNTSSEENMSHLYLSKTQAEKVKNEKSYKAVAPRVETMPAGDTSGRRRGGETRAGDSGGPSLGRVAAAAAAGPQADESTAGRVRSKAHPTERPHRCDACGRRFLVPVRLAEHRSRVHAGDMPYACAACGRTFARACTLARHRSKVHPDRGEHHRSRDLCGRRFAWSVNTTQHRNRAHPGETSYACHVCGLTFVSSGGLIEHRSTAHCSAERSDRRRTTPPWLAKYRT